MSLLIYLPPILFPSILPSVELHTEVGAEITQKDKTQSLLSGAHALDREINSYRVNYGNMIRYYSSGM